MIPKHTTGLKGKDYSHYFLSPILQAKYERPTFQEIWESYIPERKLFPEPTGRHALWHFLELLNLEKGSEVLIQAYNFYVIVSLIVQKGLKPVFVDIESDTLCIDTQDLKRKITTKSKVILVTHMFGNPSNVNEIIEIAKQNNLILFEDCAHAVGTKHQDMQVSAIGNVPGGALFSFGVMKSVNSFGGGMLVLTNELGLAYKNNGHRVKPLTSFKDTFFRVFVSAFMNPKVYGWTLYPLSKFSVFISKFGMERLRNIVAPNKNAPRYQFAENTRAPFKAFMKHMHKSQLACMNESILKRKEIVELIKTRLKPIKQISLLNESKHGDANYSYFGIYVPDKFALSAHLKKNGIDNEPAEYYDCSALDQFSDYSAICINAKNASEHLIRLPSYQALTHTEANFISNTIISYYSSKDN